MKIFKLLSVIATVCIPAIACAAGINGSGLVNKNVDITVNGEKRSYWLFVPRDCPENAPLVIAMHGAGGHSTDNSPRFSEIADTAKFIVAYPQGNPIYFPVFGGTVPGWDASGEDNADAGFLKAIVNDVAAGYGIDRKRVYCCGFSNGGMNTYAMANACSDIFAAFASISGFPLNEFHLRHTGRRPVPFLHIHGKNDDFVRYRFMPVIVDEMVARSGACPIPVKTGVSGKYDKSVYEACDGGFPYVYYEIDGMGHNDFTTNTEDGNSSLTMWKFFRQYTLDSPCDTTLKWMPRIETEGYVPESHGWTVNSGKTLLAFGLGSKTDANQNVYHSLQLTTGRYKLRFKSQGEAGKTIGVKLQRFLTAAVVLNTTVPAGEEVTLFFDIENDNFGQYKLTFTRQNAGDDISVSDISIFSLTDGEASGVSTVISPSLSDGRYYTLNGMPVDYPSSGVYIRNGEKMTIRR